MNLEDKINAANEEVSKTRKKLSELISDRNFLLIEKFILDYGQEGTIVSLRGVNLQIKKVFVGHGSDYVQCWANPFKKDGTPSKNLKTLSQNDIERMVLVSKFLKPLDL